MQVGGGDRVNPIVWAIQMGGGNNGMIDSCTKASK